MKTESQEIIEHVKQVVEKKDYHDLIDSSSLMSNRDLLKDMDELLGKDCITEVKVLVNDILTVSKSAAVLLSEKEKAEAEYLSHFLPYLSQCVKEYHDSHKGELKCSCMDCQADILLRAVRYIVDTIHAREILKHAVILKCEPSSLG